MMNRVTVTVLVVCVALCCMSDAESAKVNVYVKYCGGCRYKTKLERLKVQLADFSSKIEYTSYATPYITGYFEVYVNGVLIHSKKYGDGFVDTAAKIRKIKDAIEYDMLLPWTLNFKR